jgi:hypothetical protein
MLPHAGYEPPVPEVNEEEAVLDISHPGRCTLVEDSHFMAETLILRCALRPLPLENPKIHVQLMTDEGPLKPTFLYDEESISYGYEGEILQSCWQGISLDYTGIGRFVKDGKESVFYGTTLPFGKLEGRTPLYVKPFHVERSPYQEQLTTLPSGQLLRSPPGKTDVQFLRGYGGYYKEGIALEEMQQVYYSLTSTGPHTRVRLMNSTHLQAQQTPPPHGGPCFDYQVQFIPTLHKEEYLSLPGALAAGYAKISITSELGSVVFSSFSCEPISGFPGEINVGFRGGNI